MVNCTQACKTSRENQGWYTKPNTKEVDSKPIKNKQKHTTQVNFKKKILKSSHTWLRFGLRLIGLHSKVSLTVVAGGQLVFPVRFKLF